MISSSAPPGAPRPPAHSRRRPPGRLPIALLGALLAALLAVLAAPAASAHDVLEGSDPPDGGSLSAPPERVTLSFSAEPAPTGATVTVVGPDGTSRFEQGAPVVAGDTVSVAVAPLGAAGRYEIGYRVVSSDGHPISGSVAFTLTEPGPAAAPAAPAVAPGSPAPGEPVTEPSPAATATPAEDGGTATLPIVLTAVLIVGAAVVVVLRRRA